MSIIPATPHDRPAFPNGTAGDAWMANWCERCTHDDELRFEGGCPLLLLALCGQTPAEWTDDKPGSLGEQYRCIHFRPRGEGDPEPQPQPDPDGMDGLFTRPPRAARMLQHRHRHQPNPTPEGNR